ncbi:MAG TPA: SH3 domain-containing protein [Sphingomicrobium sp.]
MADVALAGRVIASHYAEPLARKLAAQAVLRALPMGGSEALRDLDSGDPFAMLDNSLGWAWGYAGDDRRVGYVKSEALGL